MPDTVHQPHAASPSLARISALDSLREHLQRAIELEHSTLRQGAAVRNADQLRASSLAPGRGGMIVFAFRRCGLDL
jgi:hypothetical protein